MPSHFATGKLRRTFEITVIGSGLLPFFAAKIGMHADPECNADPSKVGGYVRKEPIASPYNYGIAPIKFELMAG